MHGLMQIFDSAGAFVTASQTGDNSGEEAISQGGLYLVDPEGTCSLYSSCIQSTAPCHTRTHGFKCKKVAVKDPLLSTSCHIGAATMFA